MTQSQNVNAMGLRLPRRALRVLRERGIFAQAAVGLHYQNLGKRYVVRGVESGGAAGDVGRYVTFARENGDPIECLHPVESIGVNGPHAVVVAPILVRLDMLRKGRTYELLITRHAPGPAEGGQRPSFESLVLFRGVHGRLEGDLGSGNKAHANGALPAFYSLAGEEVSLPPRFQSAVRSLVKAVQCSPCSHSHYVVPDEKKRRRMTKDEAVTVDAGVPANPGEAHRVGHGGGELEVGRAVDSEGDSQAPVRVEKNF